jgi:hypothetical protein
VSNQPPQNIQQPLRRDFEKYNAHGPSRNKGPRIFFMTQGSRTTVVLLDDIPVRICRHKLFIKGDKEAAKMRQTCAGMDPAQYSDPVPRMCLVCEGSLRDRRIGRDDFSYLTLIDERQFEYQGKQYQDMKLLVELDDRLRDIINENRRQFGTLVGMRFQVYRSDTPNSSRIGDSWTPMGRVGVQQGAPPNTPANLPLYFWKSPAVAAILEGEQKRGKKDVSYQSAVAMLVSAVNYQEVMGYYNPAEAEQFVGYLSGTRDGGANRANIPPPPGNEQYMAQGQVPQTPQQPPYAPPTQPQYPQQAPPPGYPQAPQYQGAPPMGMAQGMPPQGYGAPPAPHGYGAPPPPSMPDPQGASMPQGGFQAPPPPPQAQSFPSFPPQGYQPQPPAPQMQAPPMSQGQPPQGYPAFQPQGQPQPPQFPAGFGAPPPQGQVPMQAPPQPQHGQVPPQGAHGQYGDPPF